MLDSTIKFNTEASLARWYTSHSIHSSAEGQKEFVDANAATIDFVGRAWLPMLYSNDTLWQLLKCANVTDDFFKTYNCIKQWDDKALEWVSGQPECQSDIQLPPPFNGITFQELHQAAGYPKRTPLIAADWLEQEAHDKFLTAMFHTKEDQDDPDGLRGEAGRRYDFFKPYLPMIRRWLDEVLPGVGTLREAIRNIDQFDFSPGAVMDACTNPFCKWFRAKYYTWRVDSTLEVTVYPDPVAHRNGVEEAFRALGSEEPRSWRQAELDGRMARAIVPKYVVKAITVPKQLSSYRVVCPERAYNSRIQNALMKCVRSFWEEQGLDRMFCFRDQDLSRTAAYTGAATGRFATIDSTSASDTVFRDWIREIDHPSLTFLSEYMPTHVKWGNEVYPMQMFGTMGSALTWYVMMVILYVDIRLSEVLTQFGEERDAAKQPVADYIGKIFFVGDDEVVPSEWAETVLDVMRLLHRIPNQEKTYITGPYRESCGIEALGSRDISRIFYPRGLVMTDDLSEAVWDGKKEAYTSPIISLINHHNELVKKGYTDTATVVRNMIAAQVDLCVGLDPVGMFSDTIVGTSGTLVLNSKEERSTSVFFEVPQNGGVLLYSPVMRWVDAAPARKCWCDGVPKGVFNTLMHSWEQEVVAAKGRYANEFKGIPNAYPAYTMRNNYCANVHKKPHVTLELVKHI